MIQCVLFADQSRAVPPPIRRLRYGSDYAIGRLCFDEPVDTPEQAAAAMQRITTSQSSDEVGLGGIDVE